MHTRVAAAREPQCRAGIPGEKVEKCAEQRTVVLQRRRKLPEDRSEFRAQREDAGREEIGQRSQDVPEPQDVCDVAWAFHAEYEVVGRLLAPALPARRRLQ